MRSSKVFITTILILCLIPAVLTIFLPTKAVANEILSSSPSIGIHFLEECADWMNDHFALRHEFSTWWAKLNAKILQTSVEEKVILGTSGELYYAEDFDLSMTEDQLDEAAYHISLIQQEMENAGKTFIFTIAPDKSSLHGENLPNNLTKVSSGRAIKPYLEKYGVNYADLFDEKIPYYRTDSHWTSYGAALACDRILGTSYAALPFTISEQHTGDLYEMLYPAGEETEENLLPELSYEVQGTDNGGNAITIETTGAGEGSLYCFRDSFGIALYPYLASSFENAVFSREKDYTVDACEDADIVILEIVERNLDTFLNQ